MRNPVPPIREDAATLKQYLQHEHDSHEKPRLHMRAYLDLFLPGIRGQEACGFTAFIL